MLAPHPGRQAQPAAALGHGLARVADEVLQHLLELPFVEPQRRHVVVEVAYRFVGPAGDELVLDFAKQALAAEQLGKDDVTDYLSVSFSSTDYVGHVFGPSSLEAEDNILRLDAALADLFAFVESNLFLQAADE